MKSPRQQKTDQRDNRLVLRWAVIAVVVLLIGALSYGFFGQRHVGEEHANQATPSAAPAERTQKP